jgi:hypothetical protein
LKPFDSLLQGLDELPSILVKTRKDNLVQVDEKKKKKNLFFQQVIEISVMNDIGKCG